MKLKALFFSTLILATASCKSRDYNSSKTDVASWEEKSSKGYFVSESDNQALFDLYKKNIPEIANPNWFVVELPEEYQMPQGEPLPKFYNNFLIWAMDAQKKPVAGFRAINTTTGCSTGCTPVIFHLKLNLAGSTKQIVEESDKPLKKINHQDFTEDDRKKILNIAAELPTILEGITEPKQTTENMTQFPPQTWTTLKPYLVEGGAYTSFRIYETALKTKEYIRRTKKVETFVGKWVTYAKGLTSTTNPPQIQANIPVIIQQLKLSGTPAEGKSILLSKTPEMLLAGLKADNTLSLASSAKSFFALSQFKTSHKTNFCDFYFNLLDFQQGRSVIGFIDKEKSSWPSCEASVDKTMPLLAAAISNNATEVKARAVGIDFLVVPPFVKKQAQTLEAFGLAAKLAGNTSAHDKIMAELKVQYPDYKPGQGGTGNTALQSEYERQYREQLRRGFLQSSQALPGVTLYQGTTQYTIPKAGKQMYVLFASWCPHCRDTLTQWVNANLPESLWNKIQLVEVYQKGQNQTQEFCNTTGLTRVNKCQLIGKVNEANAETSRFYQSLSLSGVPRIVITNSKGIIKLFNHTIDMSAGRDYVRDLTWIMEEADK